MKLFIGLLFILIACSPQKEEPFPLPYYLSSDLTPHWPDEEDLEMSELHTIPEYDLYNQQGEKVRSADFKGSIVVANFFFTTCPGVCRLMTKELMAVQDEYSDRLDVAIVSHSVMPWVDTVEQLKRFEQLNGLDGSFWTLLTGDKEVVYDVARNGYFADEGFGKAVTSKSDFLHTENVMLVDKTGHIRGVYNGTSRLDIARLLEDIDQLLEST